jgi:hypothetical protein
MLRRTLLSLPGAVCVQGPDSARGCEWLVFSFEASTQDRSGTLVLTVENEQAVLARRRGVPPSAVKELTVDGLVGVVRMLAGAFNRIVVLLQCHIRSCVPAAPYICAITSSSLVGKGPGASTFHCVKKIEFIGFPNASKAPSALSAAEAADEQRFLAMFRSIYETSSFYFACNYEITHTAQRMHTYCVCSACGCGSGCAVVGAGMQSLSVSQPVTSVAAAWTRADDRLTWNRHMLDDFYEARRAFPAVDAWVTPLINGYIGAQHVSFGAARDPVDLLLISRRSRHRQGTRFFRRGIDFESDVANFVETEQLLLHRDGRLVSLVQVRGSIPVFWSQLPTMKYTPRCSVHHNADADKVRAHGLCLSLGGVLDNALARVCLSPVGRCLCDSHAPLESNVRRSSSCCEFD